MRTQSFGQREQTERRPRVGKIGSELSQAFVLARPKAELRSPKDSRRHEEISRERDFRHFTCRATLFEPCCQPTGNMFPSRAPFQLDFCFFWSVCCCVFFFGQGFCLHKRPSQTKSQIIYNLWENGRITAIAVNTFECCECAIEVNCS